ncbi:MAG: methyl-accepting chemotaxis protein, partial [Myxococcales bacterium]|nr:methyl-accepting chemotaxis protein [Myxococcales bacterium]
MCNETAFHRQEGLSRMHGTTLDRSRRNTERQRVALAAGGALASGGGALLASAWFGAWGAAVWLLVAVAGAVSADRWLWNRIRGPVTAALAAIERIAEGDYDVEVSAAELGPMAPFSTTLNTLSDRQRLLSREVSRVIGLLRELPAGVQQAIEEVDSGRGATEEAVEETASLLANINTSIRSINGEVESLSRSTEEASSSILEMQSSIDEVARSAASLTESVDASTSSIHEISASMRQVSDSADSVQGMAEESAAAMVEMDRAIQEVGDHVREASGLTEKVSQGAEEGSRAVTATIDGIVEIRVQTSEAKTVLERLAQRIGEIGEIVNVIGSINDETNLLSLNAAIIAAQAGEQGKAFAVVANHVKTLAQRTASSTGEIETLIRAVQEESSNAVQAMGAGMDAVEVGVARSRKAGEELDTIRVSAREANSRVAEIARAANEQIRNSKHVAEAAQNTSSMVQQISAAMSEQSRAGDAMLKNAEAALELCRQVHRSTEEQRESGRFITASISSVTEMIRSIQGNTESHSAASEAVADAVTRILDVAQKSGEQIPNVRR